MEDKFQYRVCYKRPEELITRRYIVDSLEQAIADTQDYNPYAEEWIERRKVTYSNWSLYDPKSSTALDPPENT